MDLSAKLDPSFYTNLYADVKETCKNAMAIEQHYLISGKKENRVPNADVLASVLCELLTLDTDMYTALNIGTNQMQSIKDMCPLLSNKRAILEHFIKQDASGNLVGSFMSINHILITNATTLQSVSLAWKQLLSLLDAKVQFDMDFYVQHYGTVDHISTRMELLEHWLTVGLFVKQQVPNQKYVDKLDTLIQDLVDVLRGQNVSMDYLLQEYKAALTDFAVKRHLPPATLNSQTQQMLYLFFQAEPKLHLFWNLAQRQQYQQDWKQLYQTAMDAVQQRTVPKLLQQRKSIVDKELVRLVKQETRVVWKNIVVPLLSANQLNTHTLLARMTNPVFLENMKRIHGLATVQDVLVMIVKQHVHRLGTAQVSLPMELKTFVLNLVYNTTSKQGMSKAEFLARVKTEVLSILEKVIAAVPGGDMSPELQTAVATDVDFLLANKRYLNLAKAIYFFLRFFF